MKAVISGNIDADNIGGALFHASRKAATILIMNINRLVSFLVVQYL